MSGERHATNLPIQLTSFIGRGHELAHLESLLASSRLVTLTGTAGSGKTRLAIHAAHAAGGMFADGVWWMDLTPLREPALVAQLVSLGLGLRPDADQPHLEALQSFLRFKKLLLILDNCEHLSEACAHLASGLLSHAPEITILATSREALRIGAETVYQVAGLTWPVLEPGTLRGVDLKEWAGYDAVSLFVERARAISPVFSVTPENVRSVAEICRRLDGLPLALELASARVNVLTVQEIAARLDDRFALLTSTQRRGINSDSPQQSHHHTLREAIDWSYDLLAADEQLLLRRLAVFPGGCTLDSIEAICAGEDADAGQTLDRVSSLAGKSLIVADTAARAQARYRLLESIREYALEKLVAGGGAEALRDRHLRHFLARAEEAAHKLWDAYQLLWLNWLEGEHDNLRSALSWSLESKQIEAGTRAAIALRRFWEIRGYAREGLTWFERLLADPEDGISPDFRVSALVFASFLAYFLGTPLRRRPTGGRRSQSPGQRGAKAARFWRSRWSAC